MDGLGQDGPLVPVDGTVVFALVTAQVVAGQAPSIAAAGFAAQRALLSRAAALVAAPQGRVVERQGDGLLLMFTGPEAALAWALAAQALGAGEASTSPPTGAPSSAPTALALRLGLHHGQVLTDGTALFGHGVNLAARIAAVAGPGETLLSAATQAKAQAEWRAQMEDLGPYYLKHFDEPQQLFILRASPHLRMTGTA